MDSSAINSAPGPDSVESEPVISLAGNQAVDSDGKNVSQSPESVVSRNQPSNSDGETTLCRSSAVEATRALEAGSGIKADASVDSVTDSASDTVGDSFLSSVVLLLGLTVAQKLIGFVRTVVVCRMLPPEEMGLWSMMQVTMATVLPIVLLSIPACFGRYFEFYRGRHQLRAFIKQSTLLCGGLLLLGVTSLIVFRVPVAQYTLGGSELSLMVVYSALALVPFAIFSFMTELLTALRYSRLTTIGHFINGAALAAISIGLLYASDATATSMIIAFGTAYVLSLVWMISRMKPIMRSLPTDRQKLPFRMTWSSMAPVILLFWFNDFMTNMFSMSDRYMLVNLIPGETSEVLRQIGNYESGHVIPILFAAVTALVAKTLMPYMASAWEKGDRSLVSQQTHLSIKMITGASIAGGLLFLPLSSFLFDTIFQGKYDGGSSVLPYLVFFYVGSGFTALIMNFYWCAGRAPWAVLALVLGVAINVGVNFLLVPSYGIVGAAIGTSLGITCQVSVLLLIAHRFGLSVDRGTIMIGLASGLLLLDSTYSLLWCGILLGIALLPGTLSTADWAVLRESAHSLTDRVKGMFAS